VLRGRRERVLPWTRWRERSVGGAWVFGLGGHGLPRLCGLEWLAERVWILGFAGRVYRWQWSIMRRACVLGVGEYILPRPERSMNLPTLTTARVLLLLIPLHGTQASDHVVQIEQYQPTCSFVRMPEFQFVLVAQECVVGQVFLCDQVRLEIVILEKLAHCHYESTVKCVVESRAFSDGTCVNVHELFVTKQTHDDGRSLRPPK
jgi:hypothetical protein